MKIYREVLIESAEQAEALPVGTIAKDGDLSVAVKAEGGHWARTDVADGLPMMGSSSMVGWTALVAHEVHERKVRARGEIGPGIGDGTMLYIDFSKHQAYHERMVWSTEWKKSEGQG